jgi:carboxypeptidase PM20D1
MKKFFAFLLIVLLILTAVLLWNASHVASYQIKAARAKPIQLDKNKAAADLAGAIRIPTVSYEIPADRKMDEIIHFHQYLESTFPHVAAALTHETVNGYSLLYTWKGQDESLAPIVLISHMDVVPIAPGTETKWTHPPFDGAISDGYIWGRGSIDDKAGVIAILESTELLLAEGFKPKRTFYFGFGHDEEVSGQDGAAHVADLLASRGVRPEFLLDEGGLIGQGLIPNITKPIAFIGIAEKGYLTVKLTVVAQTGHSSMPPPHTAIGIMSEAINKVEENQFPSRLCASIKASMSYLAPEMPLSRRIFLANLWLFEPVVSRTMLEEPSSAATVRTTTAVTVISGGVKDNVLPGEAHASVNFRILPGDTVQSVLQHVSDVIADQRVKVEKGDFSSDPSPESDVHSQGFQSIQSAVAATSPDAIVVPNLVVGATDSRHYQKITNQLFRFLPLRLAPEDLERVHGIDERISVDNFAECVAFFHQLMMQSGS